MAQTVDLTRVELMENWSETNPNLRMRNTFAFFKGFGAENSAVVYFELEPGNETGFHRDSAEETILVVEGDIEASIENESTRLSALQMMVIPRDQPHNVRNIGSTTARIVGFFASGHVQSRFSDVLLPENSSDFDTAEIPV